MQKAQISIEYLIIVSLVLLLVVVPTAIFLSSFAKNSLFGTVADEQVRELGDGLVNGAEQVYYLGLYAKQKVTLPFPKNVDAFFLLTINNAGEDVSYVVLMAENFEKKYYFQSDVPLAANSNSLHVVAGADLSYLIPECGSMACATVVYGGDILREGKREFVLETVQDGGSVVVEITPVVG